MSRFGFPRALKLRCKKRRTIRHSLLRLFLSGMLIPLLLLSAVLSVFVYKLTTNQMSEQYESELTIAGSEIARTFENLTDMARNLMRTNGTSGLRSSDSLYSVVTNNAEDAYPFDVYKLPIFRKIRSIISSTYLRQNPSINGIYLLMANGNAYSFSLHTDFPGSLDYRNTEWFRRALVGEANPAVLCEGIRAISPQSCITFVWPIAEVVEPEPLGVILIDCNRDFFAPIQDQLGELDSYIYLVDARQNQWIAKQDVRSAERYLELEQTSASPSGSYFDSAQRRLTVWHTSSGLKLIYDVPNRFLSSRFAGMLYASAATILLAIATAIVSAVLLSRSFANPLANLVENMVSSSSRLPSASEHYEGEDEFVQLYKGYNRMIAAVDDYIMENYMYKLSNMELKMKAIERQIDTHFMYNTLDCVYTLAITQGADGIASVVKGLGDMFRYVTKIASPTIALREELKYTQDYIIIQKARYEEMVEFVVDVPEALGGCMVLRLSLQPMVENALKHGYGCKEGVLHVSVRAFAELDDMLTISVSDDGGGIARDKLEELRASLLAANESVDAGGSGIGLRNIQDRLKLVYGEHARMTLGSVLGSGTTVAVHLPIDMSIRIKGT